MPLPILLQSNNPPKIMAMACRSRLRFREPWPLHHPHLCCYLHLVWLISLTFLLMEVAGVEGRVSSKGCLKRERDALLLYKAAFEDPSARLASWRARADCCSWTGVVCHNRTGSVRVAELNLQNPNAHQPNESDTALRGELLHPSLLSLAHLLSLNLSFNDFEGAQIPPLVGSLRKLKYLDLSESNFSGTIPPHLGNLTNLRHLRLMSYHYPYSAATVGHSLEWLSGLSSLIHLDMSFLNLSAASRSWVSAINMLPSLQQLYLLNCRINNIPLSLNYHLNLTSLEILDLGFNNFNSSFPNWFWNLTSLSCLRLQDSGIRGALPNEIGNLINLVDLDLSSDLLSDSQLDVIWKLEHLAKLDLSNNLLGNSLLVGIMNLSSLSTLILDNCSLVGPLPSELGNLSTLNVLSLRSNSLSGPIPIEIGKLINLKFLDLSNNSFEGDITEIHLSNLTKLKELHLDNPFLTIATDHNWTPLFQLELIDLSSCKLGPRFPTWLRSQQSISIMDLHNTSIEDNLPEWFCSSSSSITFLDLSHNKISGTLPACLESLTKLSNLVLSSNLLEGSLPHFPPNLDFLDLSFNAFSGPLLLTLFTPQLPNHTNGSIPSNICNSPALEPLNLSNNQINREIPRCCSSSFKISFLNLSYNKISGVLQASIKCLTNLAYLILGSNLLEGPLPHFLPHLFYLDLSFNAFSGPLPPTLFTQNLNYLFLSHNCINGSIPSTICNSHELQRLNFSNNNISGEIPQCWKDGSLLKYADLGNNMLFGEIPGSLGNLRRLESLHLNDNNLKGQLPSSLQNCKQLVIVDLGDNKFSGNIPLWIGQSWQQLRILRLSSNIFNGKIDLQLGHLRNLQIIDLANNKLSGPIPRSFRYLQAMISRAREQLPILDQGAFFIEYYWERMTLVAKGGQLIYSSNLYLVKSIDLSNNYLTDEIPEELGYLVELQTLNLSRNYFKGKIPNSIGRMRLLETLDLSFNNLSGVIPQSLSELNSLNHLNLSHNNLSGNIPSGNQLQTLDDANIYIDNFYLCGDLINKSCFDENNINITSEEHVMSSMLSIYLSSAIGYCIGLWSVFILLLLSEKWRYSYFRKIDKVYDKIFVAIKIRLNRIVNG